MKESNYYICIYHNSSQVEFDYETNTFIPNRPGKSIASIVYDNISDLEAVVVLTRHYFVFDNVEPIVNHLLSLNVNKIIFYIEDVLQFYDLRTLEKCNYDIHNEYIRSYDLDIIKKIIDLLSIDYEVFHCEYNATHLEKIYEIRIKYCDVFLLSTSVLLMALGRIDYLINYKMSCFNARFDYHRYIIASLLHDKKEILLTLLYTQPAEVIINNLQIPLNDFSKETQEKIISGCQILETGIDLSWDIKRNSIKTPSINPYRQSQNIKIIQKSAVDLVTETKFYSTMPNISEKVLKPMNVCRPFLLLAPPGTLALLKKLGFKTFDQWWDESYDLIDNHSLRLESVYKIAETLLSKSNDELIEMLKEMAPILIHNSKHIKNMYEPMINLNN